MGPEADQAGTIEFENASPTPVKLWLEPWGDGLTVAPEARVAVRVSGHGTIDLLVSVKANEVAIWVQTGKHSLEFDEKTPR